MGNSFCCQNVAPSQSFQSNMQNKSSHLIIHYRLNNVNICITQGSIFNEHVDAIVIVTNTKLKPSSNTAKELRTLAGPSMHDEITKLLLQQGGRLSHGQVVYSHAGDLDYDFIFYAVLPSFSDSSQMMQGSTSLGRTCSSEFQPTNSLLENLKNQSNIFSVYNDTHGGSKHEKQHIFECILSTLEQADKLGLKSIAFPVMQPVSSQLSLSLIATVTLVAIKTFVSQNKSRFLKNIHITTTDTPTMQMFKWSFQQIIIENLETPNIPVRLSHYQSGEINLNLGGEKHDSVDFMKDIDAEEYIRFGHAIEKDNEIKENPNNISL